MNQQLKSRRTSSYYRTSGAVKSTSPGSSSPRHAAMDLMVVPILLGYADKLVTPTAKIASVRNTLKAALGGDLGMKLVQV